MGNRFKDVVFVVTVSVSFVFTIESDLFADFGEHLRGDAEERGNGVKRQVVNDSGTTAQQQLVTLAGRGTVQF